MLDPFYDRCRYCPRPPLLVLSPYAKSNAVDHGVTDQSSVLRFVEDSLLGGKRIDGSYDQLTSSLDALFHFNKAIDNRLVLDPDTGAPTGASARPDAAGQHGRNQGVHPHG